MIEPESKRIPGIHQDVGVMYKFGDLGYVSVYADGHIRLGAYSGTDVTHAVNNSDRPGEHVLTVRPKKG